MKKFFKSPYTIGILTGLIVLIIWSLISDYMSGNKLLTMLSNMLKLAYSAILSFLNFNIKVWWLLVAIGVLVAILWLIAQISENKEPQRAKWLNYTDDIIDGFHWKWMWEKIYGNTYDIKNLHPICSDCQTPLTQTYEYQYSLQCPRCKKKFSGENLKLDNIKIIIHDNVSRMIEEEKILRGESE